MSNNAMLAPFGGAVVEDWEVHKETIYDLYISRDQGLKEVISHMKEKCGFSKTKSQYGRQLKKWNFCKNSRGADWKIVSYKVQKRTRQGKDSAVYRRGKKVETKKLIKERRHNWSHATALYMPAESPKTPDEFAICTPYTFNGDALALSTYATNLPCLQLFSHLKSLASGYSKIDGGTKTQYLPFCQSVISINKDYTPGATSLCIQNVPRIGAQPDYHEIDWSSRFAELCVEDIEADGYAYLTSGELLIRKHNKNSSQHLASVASEGKAMQGLLSMLYMASNNLLEAHHASSAFRLIGQSNLSRLFSALRSSQFPAVKAIARSLLPDAIESGSISLVESILDTGIDPSSPLNYDRETALEIAVRYCGIEMTAVLLGRGAKTASSPRALARAVAKDDLKLVQLLLSAGAHDNHRLKWEKTALQHAASNGNAEMVQLLLSHGTDVNVTTEGDRKTALHTAAKTGNYKLVQMLLDSGASDLTSALPAAIRTGDSELIELLMRAGADTTGYLAKPGEETALQAAAVMGNYELTQVLLDLGADINAPATSRQAMTALQGAACIGDLELIQLLLHKGAHINASSAKSSTQTALHAAIKSGDLEVVQYLLDSRADINAPSTEETVLQAAIKCKDLEMIQLLLKSGADVNMCSNDYGIEIAPLEVAAETGEATIVQLLLDAGAGPLDYSVLKRAVEENSLPVIKLLLDLGADCNKVDSDDRTVVESLISDLAEIEIETIRLLLEYGADTTRILSAVASSGSTDIARMLLESGADANVTWRQTSALAKAACRGDLEMVRLLLGYGANDRTSALAAAASTSNIDLVSLLLRSGADANAHYFDGFVSSSALQQASWTDNAEVVDLLLQSGADPNMERPGKWSQVSALERAAEGGNLKILKLLLDAGAFVERSMDSADTVLRVTALQRAATRGHFCIVDELIRRGADVNAPPRDERGRTALEGAAEHGRLDTVQLLINAGANVHTSRALHFAQEEGHDAVVQLLMEQ